MTAPLPWLPVGTPMMKETASTSRSPKRSRTGSEASFLFDPRRGDASFRLGDLDGLDDRDGAAPFAEPKRFNYFTILFIREGGGCFQTEELCERYDGPVLLFFNPYQTFHLLRETSHEGRAIQFHANFFCLEAHHEAVGCNGVLFNDIYGLPLVRLSQSDVEEVDGLLESMAREQLDEGGIAGSELLISYLKVLLIRATRLKLEQQGDVVRFPDRGSGGHSVPRKLQRLIEKHFRTLHRPCEYAALLEITPKQLGRLVKKHFHKTPTELIRERVLKEAKWQLLHTQRPVREIASEVGFEDEFYFSRLFRYAVGDSPSRFREYETLIRGGSNLSM